MQRPQGYRCPGSGQGFPHGKHKKEARRRRAEQHLKERADVRHAR